MNSNAHDDSSVVYSTEPEDFYYIDINIPCQGACPAYTNIPAYIRALYEKQYGRSYEINQIANIFPGVLGRICSRPCEDKCRHGENELGTPVNICHVKRAAADFMEETPSPLKVKLPCLNKKIAIIGAGPAGLAAAHDLATIGFDVTIFEAFDKPGGMLRYGIPEFRLPRNIIENEIDRILALGISLKTGVKAGTDISIESLFEQHDAVLMAAGCYQSNKLGIPGEEFPEVYSGLEFMIDACEGIAPPVGEKVLVIGAGFTAFDCARSSLRLGAKDIRICLRRTEDDLTVTKDEISETKLEGIKIESLLLSKKIIGNGNVKGIEFLRTQPGEVRADGKRKISPIQGSEFVLRADTVIIATGQQAVPMSLSFKDQQLDLPAPGTDSYVTPIKGFYTTGDYLSGPTTVIDAVANGRWAAEKIASDLTGNTFRQHAVRMQDTDITDRPRTWDFIPRREMPVVQPVKNRLKGMDMEVETGFDPSDADEESKRCYLCYLHYEIDISKCIYCRYCIDVAPRDCIKLVEKVETNEVGAVTGLIETKNWEKINAVVIDNKRCIRCGECVRVCPVDCISVTKVELVERMLQVEADNG